MLKIKLYGEGHDDVGDHEKENADSPLYTFLSKVLEQHKIEREKYKLLPNQLIRTPFHAGRPSRVLDRAIYHASERDCKAVVFVVDHDIGKEEIELIKEAREKAKSEDHYLPTALGFPKMELEAWLLADGKSRRKNLGPAGGEGISKIEEDKNPKKKFDDLYELHNQGKEDSEKLEKFEVKCSLARDSEINTLLKNCPKSFKSFMEEVRENLLREFKDT